MNPEEFSKWRAELLADFESTKTKLEEEIEWARGQIAVWDERLKKEKKGEKVWLIALTQLQLNDLIFTSQTTITFMERIIDTGTLTVANAMEIDELASKIPELDKVREEYDKTILNEVNSLKDLAKQIQERVNARKASRPLLGKESPYR